MNKSIMAGLPSTHFKSGGSHDLVASSLYNIHCQNRWIGGKKESAPEYLSFKQVGTGCRFSTRNIYLHQYRDESLDGTWRMLTSGHAQITAIAVE